MRRLRQSLRDRIAVIPALPGRVVTVNPEAMAVTPSPMARNPKPAHAVIIVPRTVVVISVIADLDIDSDGLGSHRSESARAEKRGQQHSKFVFHMFFLVRISTEPGRILFEILQRSPPGAVLDSRLIARAPKARHGRKLPRGHCRCPRSLRKAWRCRDPAAGSRQWRTPSHSMALNRQR